MTDWAESTRTISYDDYLALRVEYDNRGEAIVYYINEVDYLKRILRTYHYDSREHGGQTDYKSVATLALEKYAS